MGGVLQNSISADTDHAIFTGVGVIWSNEADENASIELVNLYSHIELFMGERVEYHVHYVEFPGLAIHDHRASAERVDLLPVGLLVFVVKLVVGTHHPHVFWQFIVLFVV